MNSAVRYKGSVALSKPVFFFFSESDKAGAMKCTKYRPDNSVYVACSGAGGGISFRCSRPFYVSVNAFLKTKIIKTVIFKSLSLTAPSALIKKCFLKVWSVWGGGINKNDYTDVSLRLCTIYINT